MLSAPAQTVRRVTLYMIAQNEYEHEKVKEQQDKIDEAEAKAKAAQVS